jgi:alpha-D-ribose 1-methylphosphonate 5-triphosphate diphosphatase PhnM
MAIATFPPAAKAGFGLVKDMAARAIHRADPEFQASAPLSGQRALTRACLDETLPFASGYGAEVAMTIRALQAGLRVVEVPTTMSHAATGRDLAGFIHRGRQFVHVWLALMRLRFSKN